MTVHGVSIQMLRFANDITSLAESSTDLRKILNSMVNVQSAATEWK